MSSALDDTHDAALASWVESANGHPDFPIQNLPLGIVSPGDGPTRAAVAIGDRVLDLPDLLAAGLLEGEARRAVEAMGTTLNAFLALGAEPRRALRRRLSVLLRAGSPDRAQVEASLHAAETCALHLPVAIGDYTDFYAGIHHATAVGKLLRPDSEPLLANYKHVPIGYHGRASSVRPSGAPVRRPNGQTKGRGATEPGFGPCRRLDYELELGIWVGRGNALGEPIPIGEAADHIAGYGLLNDWSARDVQAWESQPLGPFLAKSFASTVSPWIVTPEALAPFRIAQPARPEGDPAPLPYLADPADQGEGALAVTLEAWLSTARMRSDGLAPHRLAISDTRHLYWTPAQLVAHHASGGCNLNPGDLLGSGTISGPDRSASGSLLEATLGGREPIRLASGEERRFLEDGDEIMLTARCVRDGFASIGFGPCRAVVLPAHPVA